jgi:hypothetical protein
MIGGLWERLRARGEWKFASALVHADRPLATAWWSLLVLRGVLPAIFAIVMGSLVAALQQRDSLAALIAAVGIVLAA